jgi:hypothetical protein
MEIASSTAQTASLLQVAVQKQMLDQMKVQGASMVQMLASASPGSTSSPTQGKFIDALA